MSILVECKKLCLRRCMAALVYSIAMQYMLLGIFLFFINFQVLHPLKWVGDTVGLFFSFYTWFSILPLIGAVILYCILLGKSFLVVKRYYATRFQWLVYSAPRKALFLVLHLLVGYLTAWLYANFWHVDYRNFVCDCYGTKCINGRYLFLVCVGIFAACLHFAKENLRKDPELEFPIVQELLWVRIRSLVYRTLYHSMLRSFTPTISFGLVYWLIGGIITSYFADAFGVDVDESMQSFFAIAVNLRLLFYGWILAAQILSNMHLMQHFFAIQLSEEVTFVIERKPVLCGVGIEEITLVDAINSPLVPVVQNLGARDLYRISSNKAESRRKEIYALSVPGAHPYNWNQLSAQCLSLINAFTEELAASLKKISAVKTTPLFATVKPTTATDAAEKILLRQYNETFGIRRMMAEPCQENIETTMKMSPACKRIHDKVEKMKKQLEQTLRAAFRTIPGLFYMFGETEGARTTFLLSNSDTILWTVQGLAGICAASLTEDKYGVVQVTLPQVIKSLLGLKTELDKLNNVNLNGKKLDRNFVVLKNGVKRSLYNICTVFRDYLRELVDSAEDLRKLQCYVHYMET
ncbi:PREDICTED: nucleoporin Ndc1 [Rhagoletis zephyria]|uniref:nucleoporin Ndc1 n=1 Tax=Rhagoletis zephyria TaxID=28612 RepID=UPI0008117DA3|nr:PREDICTED: nucleoporin Ndc1 [Rhagoletis zephyria]